MTFEIYTDGSSFIDGDKKGSSAGYIIYLKERMISYGGTYFAGGTNNKGESMAVLMGLNDLSKRIEKARDNLVEKGINTPYKIRVVGDSFITIEGCRTWIYDWIKNGKNGKLISSSGDEVANAEVFKEIYSSYLKNKDFEIEFLHVNSHLLDKKLFTDNMDALKTHFHIGGIFEDDNIPSKFICDPQFKISKSKFEKKNKKKISSDEFLRLLIHNKECDELAANTLTKGIKSSKKLMI